ncbi:MAG: hypothetical protein ABIS50_04570 [Luteolibacter sp.]|uniref:tetratricopeptide repeat protein n=1 Tax=Luteolibacter sp. TaxID=1962973 RepID=UPI003267E2CF
MKFHSVLMVTSLSAWGWIVAAAPEPIVDSAGRTPTKSVEEWVRDLSDDQFRVRENATRKIWEIGEGALPALQAAANGKDPETSYRARELVRKIELHLTPDTDPEVMKLVERYAKASTDEKQTLIDEMRHKRAWRQILKLFASEKNTQLQKRIQGTIDEVAVIAARECLLKGDPDGAREYLEMAPADPAGLVALADFHRSQGTLDAELKRAKTLKGENSNAWQLALYRASGNIEAARDAATAAGEVRISAAMSLLLGDPVPWMRKNLINTDGVAVHKPYTELAIKRWQGKKLLPTDLEPLVKSLSATSVAGRRSAINSLFLLGEAGLAEESYTKISPGMGFVYFNELERVPEALKALGLDPEKPDYAAWVEKRISSLAKEDGDGEEERLEMATSSELVLLANFMDRRGLSAEFSAAFAKPLAALAEKDEKAFTSFLALLFGNSGRFSGAPDMAKHVAFEWAGENGERWEDILIAAFGEDQETNSVWEWLADLDPKATRIDRFEGLLALSGVGTDPLHLRDKWLSLGWKSIEQTPENQRKPLFAKMAYAIGMSPDVTNNLKLWDLYPANERDDFFRNSCISELAIAGRWNEAAAFFLEQIARVSKFKLDPSPATHASAAACLRKAGKAAEAAVQDEWVEKLSLGHDAYEIAIGYQFGDDGTKAAEWFERALRLEEPSVAGGFSYALEEHGDRLLDSGKWQQAAAIFEVKAQMLASLATGLEEPTEKLKLRLQSDLGRALANLKTDHAGSLGLLEHCYQMFPGDGTLADYFFPSIRKVGLIKEHDAWFKISWDRMNAVVKAYPGSSNTLNTTGWLAARALRNLDQAEELQNKALSLKPDEWTYLDTMAEIQFAKGNRNKALEWSTRSVNFTPGGDGTAQMESLLSRRQHEHFRVDPLPK